MEVISLFLIALIFVDFIGLLTGLEIVIDFSLAIFFLIGIGVAFVFSILE